MYQKLIAQERPPRCSAGGKSSEHLTSIALDPLNRTTQALQCEIEKYNGIPYSRFMELCLFGPEGYYSAGKAVIGRDFNTSPSVSPIFSIMVCKIAYLVWQAMGQPKKFTIVEMGPGGGHLALSFLQWARKLYPAFYARLQYVLVENSPGMLEQQKKMLAYSRNVRFVNGSAVDLPLKDIKGILISNELLDTFPVEIVTRIDGRIKQKYISIRNDMWVEEWREPEVKVSSFIDTYSIHIKKDIEEPLNMRSVPWAHKVCSSLKKGAVITIDYGELGEVGTDESPTIMLYGNERYIGNVFEQGINVFKGNTALGQFMYPGQLDITTEVNFKPLKIAFEQNGLREHFSGIQRDFFNTIGAADLAPHIKEQYQGCATFTEVIDWHRGYCTQTMMRDFMCRLDLNGVEMPSLSASDLDTDLEFLSLIPLLVIRTGKPRHPVIMEGVRNTLPMIKY